jgi:peptide/nickel transport system permease protein
VGRPASADRVGYPEHRLMHFARVVLQDGRARFGLLVILLAIVIAAAAPLLAGDPVLQRDIVATRFLPPLSTDSYGAFHALGTDRFGRDVWARLAFGARISLGVGVLAVLLSVAIGVVIGAAAGFWRGAIGMALLGVTDFALALPRVVLLLLLASLWQPSATLVVAVLGLTGWMTIARLVHGEVRALSERPFVESAFALGERGPRVLLRHILPNAMTPVIVTAALGVGNAIMLEAGLSFLGLGVQPPTPSWGNLIASGRDTLVNAPWVATAPGLALVLVVVAATMLGDALRDRLDPANRRGEIT